MLKLVILPQWLVDALKAANCDLADALKVKKLLTILSREDVAFYLYVNSVGLGPTVALRPDVCASLFDVFDLPFTGKEGYGDAIVKLCDDLTVQGQAVAVRPEGEDDRRYEVYRRDLMAQLFQHWRQPSDREVAGFDICRLGENIVGLIPVAVPATQGAAQHKKECNELLNILCGAFPFARVASTPLFTSYVRLCSVS